MERLFLLLCWFCCGSCERPKVGLKDEFPSLQETLDMAGLSLLMYRFVGESDDDKVCQSLNAGGAKPDNVPAEFSLPSDFHCHWYYHDREKEGTQVMIASSVERQYLAIVFAGTDDFQTSLRDIDIMKKPFGDDKRHWTLPHASKRVKVHAGFDNAVFSHGLFDQILSRFESARKSLTDSPVKLYTTGHSLGAAASLLTAVGLTTYYHDQHPGGTRHVRGVQEEQQRPTVTSLSFGCPCVGNGYWRDYLHKSEDMNDLAIWRFVLGWDLVPRLPELFYHAGHTVQLSRNDGKREDNYPGAALSDFTSDPFSSYDVTAADGFQGTSQAYYHHYGDQKHYASVPLGWNSLPYIWVPGAIASHHAVRYWQFFFDFQRATQSGSGNEAWVSQFVPFSEENTDDHPPNVDDDFWVDPPDPPIW